MITWSHKTSMTGRGSIYRVEFNKNTVKLKGKKTATTGSLFQNSSTKYFWTGTDWQKNLEGKDE